MPNRRTPRKPELATAHEQSRIAVPRMLGGSSAVPAPAKGDAGATPTGSVVGFQNDEFPITAGQRSVVLSKLPIPETLHVFRCKPVYGFALLEDIHWKRELDSTTVAFFAHVPIDDGDVIVAHYAYGGTP